MGYNVDVMVEKINACKTKAQLLAVAQGLRVAVNASRVSLVRVSRDRFDLRLSGDSAYIVPGAKYSVFMSLGNEKIPPVKGIRHVNFFMCQFPFDLDQRASPQGWHSFSSYDYILLNSGYTYKWFSLFSGPFMRAAIRHFGLIPQVVVLHPPIEPFHTQPAKPSLPDEPGFGGRKDIVLLGRFFQGRQSKGHLTAIRIFKQIVPQLPQGTELHLVGNLMPGHDEYLVNLKNEAVGLPVVFHVASPSSELEAVLQSSLVQWHLTGVESNTTSDPASEEHFGISIAEGMTAGTIPVVLDRGGVGDIVQHGINGFLAANPQAVAQYTVHAFGLGRNETAALQERALVSTKQFHQESFVKKFRVLVQRGQLTKPFRHLVNVTGEVVLSRTFKVPVKAENAAVLIEPRQHYALEYVVKNALYHLGGNWSLYVYHGLSNRAFVETALHGISGVNLRQLNMHTVTIPDLNKLLLSTAFWEGIDAERALLFQTDALLLRGNLGRFFQYDYVGAPWHLTNERWQHRRADMAQGVGNGGLSLRGVPQMRRLAATLGPAADGLHQEDFLYAEQLERMPGSRLAPRAEAYRFCVEVPCADLDNGTCADPACSPLETLPEVPAAVHAAWYYFSNPEDRFRDLLRMLELSGGQPWGALPHQRSSGHCTPLA
eukprot:scaffold2.g6799.t1